MERNFLLKENSLLTLVINSRVVVLGIITTKCNLWEILTWEVWAHKANTVASDLVVWDQQHLLLEAIKLKKVSVVKIFLKWDMVMLTNLVLLLTLVTTPGRKLELVQLLLLLQPKLARNQRSQ